MNLIERIEAAPTAAFDYEQLGAQVADWGGRLMEPNILADLTEATVIWRAVLGFGLLWWLS